MSETKDLVPGTTHWPPPHPENPIWPPQPPGWGGPPEWCRPTTGVWPPCPPQPCPPGPWPAGLYRFNQCWDEVAEFKAFLKRVIKDLIAEDPSIIAVGQPIVGVTNGTNAQPGMVGEFMQTGTLIGYTAGSVFQAFISAGSLPAGDWDCWWLAGTTVPIQGLQIFLNPVPAGFSGDMDMVLEVPGMTPDVFFLASPHVRALTSVASQLLFQVILTPGPLSGTLDLIFNARRRR